MDKKDENEDIIISKIARNKCIAARDRYMVCIRASKNNVQKCAEFEKKFKESCPESWVNFFETTIVHDAITSKPKLNNKQIR